MCVPMLHVCLLLSSCCCCPIAVAYLQPGWQFLVYQYNVTVCSRGTRCGHGMGGTQENQPKCTANMAASYVNNLHLDAAPLSTPPVQGPSSNPTLNPNDVWYLQQCFWFGHSRI